MRPITFRCNATLPLAPEVIAGQILDLARWPEFGGYGPLPVRSRYATVVGPSTRNVSSPLGDTFTCPSDASGAVATKNTCCRR